MTTRADAPPRNLRARRRVALMRRVQAVALDLFEARGLDAVTVEEIAARCEVSPPTLYRHFGTKEQLVLWDEYDAVVLDGLTRNLRGLPVMEALRRTILDPLERVYAADADRILRRARLADREPALQVARATAMRAFRSEVAERLLEAGSCRDRFEADVVAGAFFLALEVAIAHWASAEAAVPLCVFIGRALDELGALSHPKRP
ncbi:MAG: TetR family transcriptional regulator [Alphaproteobacteria bacterium]|nr:TetR family transcriptional regulator [Alphaproteobacteria bacterium]